jgi:MinD-like ATPase involved in chromosome partitioning or flagellar assembly
MIELGIIDLSADGRRRIASLIEKWTWASPDSRVSTPRVSLTLLSPEEIRFNGALDVCVIGPEVIGCDAAFIHTIRQQLPGKLMLCVLTHQIYSFGVVEQLGRLGVDDVLLDTASSDEFFRRLVLLQRRLSHKQKGRLVVVGSSRGGVGCTFLAASLGEGLLNAGKRVCVVDCDVISQDLTRFLRVKPHVSEPLRLLLDQQRVVTSETVAECCTAVWSDEPNVVCMPPAAGQDETIFATPRAARTLTAILEVLQTQHDFVVVDTGSLPALTTSALYQICDEAVFVANRDPGGAFAHRQALLLISGCARPDALITVVINDNSVATASLSVLWRDALSVPGRETRQVFIPRTPKASRWPCSGATPYQFLDRFVDPLVERSCGGEGSVLRNLFDPNGGWLAASIARVDWVVSKFRSGKRGRLSEEPETPTPAEQQVFPALGFTDHPFGEGELVSKPVILS